jgi:hypothetical protein
MCPLGARAIWALWRNLSTSGNQRDTTARLLVGYGLIDEDLRKKKTPVRSQITPVRSQIAARDDVGSFLAAERMCPLGTRAIRRARVGWAGCRM